MGKNLLTLKLKASMFAPEQQINHLCGWFLPKIARKKGDKYEYQ
jgi:hypothetical protein